jgi:hypothetical protein
MSATTAISVEGRNASVPGKPIADLLIAQIIEPFEHGWIVIDPVQSSAMLIRKAGK